MLSFIYHKRSRGDDKRRGKGGTQWALPLEVSRATKTASPEAVVAKEEKLQPFLNAAAATTTTSNAAFEEKTVPLQSPPFGLGHWDNMLNLNSAYSQGVLWYIGCYQ